MYKYKLDAEQYESFIRMLEDRPPPNEKLKRLFASKPIWDEGAREDHHCGAGCCPTRGYGVRKTWRGW
jgi:hypothetical protein